MCARALLIFFFQFRLYAQLMLFTLLYCEKIKLINLVIATSHNYTLIIFNYTLIGMWLELTLIFLLF